MSIFPFFSALIQSLFVVAGTDALLAGITRSAVEGVPGIPANVPVHPLINWYFMIATSALSGPG